MVVRESRMLECAGKQEKVATLNSGASDVLCKDVTKVPDDAVEATAVDQAESLFRRSSQQRSATLKLGGWGCPAERRRQLSMAAAL